MNRFYALHSVHGRLTLSCLLMLLSLAGYSFFCDSPLVAHAGRGVHHAYGRHAFPTDGALPAGPVFGGTCDAQTYCIDDPGVSLPDNNQLIIGEGAPGATRCSAHLALEQPVTVTCGDSVRYEAWIYLFDGADSVQLIGLTVRATDAAGAATLTFDTRTSPDAGIRANGIPYTADECGSRHRLVWIATDDCGETSRCTSMIALVDCQPPVHGCIPGPIVITIPTTLQVTLWAKDFVVGSLDDCTPGDDMLASWSPTQYEPMRTIICHTIPAFDEELPMPLWVADAGYDRNCDGQVDWHERNLDSCTLALVYTGNTELCENGPLPFTVSGQGRSVKGDPVSQVTLMLETPVGSWPNAVTGSDGLYGWVVDSGLTNLTIRAERNDNHKNGVSTLDLLRIQKHLLGIEPFTSPDQFIAADVNNSQHVSAIDMIELRKLILGHYTEFPSNTSWRFFEADSFPDILRSQIRIPVLDRDYPGQDFIGIKIGDVNGSVQPNVQQILPRDRR